MRPYTPLFERARYWGSRAAGIIAYNDNKEILLGLRSRDVEQPGTWSFPGGKVDADDADPMNSAMREFEEETGYSDGFTGLELLDVFEDRKPDYTFGDEGKKHPGFKYSTYIGKINDPDFSPETNWENDEFGWFPLTALPENLHFGIKGLVNKIERYLS